GDRRALHAAADVAAARARTHRRARSGGRRRVTWRSSIYRAASRSSRAASSRWRSTRRGLPTCWPSCAAASRSSPISSTTSPSPSTATFTPIPATSRCAPTATCIWSRGSPADRPHQPPMPYTSELEARIAKRTTKAIVDFAMLEDGDRVMVGLSGGKDSWALLQILDVLRQRAPIRFSLVAVNVDSGYKEYKHDLIARTCEARGWTYRIEHTGIGETIDDLLEDGATPCSLCARLRRGVLYRIAKEVGATKIAL